MADNPPFQISAFQGIKAIHFAGTPYILLVCPQGLGIQEIIETPPVDPPTFTFIGADGGSCSVSVEFTTDGDPALSRYNYDPISNVSQPPGIVPPYQITKADLKQVKDFALKTTSIGPVYLQTTITNQVRVFAPDAAELPTKLTISVICKASPASLTFDSFYIQGKNNDGTFFSGDGVITQYSSVSAECSFFLLNAKNSPYKAGFVVTEDGEIGLPPAQPIPDAFVAVGVSTDAGTNWSPPSFVTPDGPITPPFIPQPKNKTFVVEIDLNAGTIINTSGN